MSLHPQTREQFLLVGIGRKLEDIRRDLALLGEQGKAEGFFNNVENADKLSGLVEDIRDPIIGYQVCVSNLLSFLRSTYLLDVIATRHVQQELLTHRESLPLPFVSVG